MKKGMIKIPDNRKSKVKAPIILESKKKEKKEEIDTRYFDESEFSLKPSIPYGRQENKEKIPLKNDSIKLHQKILTVEDVLVQNLAEESVLLNLNNEAYYGLDEIGTRMFALLQTSDSIEIAYQSLLEEYEVAPDVLKQDLLDFIEKLLEQGLVRLEN